MSQGGWQDIPSIVSPIRQSPRLQQRARQILRKRAQAREDIPPIPEEKEELDNPPVDPPNDPDPPDDISALSDGSFNEPEIMSLTQPKGILQKMLGEEFMEPTPFLNITQAQTIWQTLSNVMSTIMDLRHKGGYLWLIEEDKNYKLCLSITDANFTLPTLPAMPKYDKKATREQMGHYNIKMAQYQLGRFWNSELLDAIQKKVPGALTAVEIHPGILPANYTTREAIKHILNNVRSETATTHSLHELTQKLLDLTYTPNANGPELYFSKAMLIQQQVCELKASTIMDKTIMDYATDAFLRSSHTKALVAAIAAEWKESNKSTFLEFRTFWNKKLKLLYENGDGNREQAKRAEELESTVRDLQQPMANMA